VQSAGSSSALDLEENYFDFRKQCFVYSKEKGTFCKLSYPTKETFGYYIKCSGHGSEAKVLAATEKWGRNVWVSLFSGHFYYSLKHHLFSGEMGTGCVGFVILWKFLLFFKTPSLLLYYGYALLLGISMHIH